jgi:TnpA family transposase
MRRAAFALSELGRIERTLFMLDSLETHEFAKALPRLFE